MNTSTNGLSTHIRMRLLSGVAMLFLISVSTSGTVSAATRALPDGQATIAEQFDTLNLAISSIVNPDDQRAGLRFQFPRFSDHFVLFLDVQGVDSTRSGIALSNDVDVSGDVGGGGIYVTDLLPDIGKFTTTLRISSQSEEMNVDSNIVISGVQPETRLITQSFSVALLLSPETPVFSNGANAYMTLGASYQRFDQSVGLNGKDQPSLSRSDREYLPELALGIVYPFKRLNLFASVSYEKDLALGLGIRVKLSRRGSKQP